MITIDKKKRKILLSKDERFGICGAIKSDGSLCANNSGKGTDHIGEGRCNWHENISYDSPVHSYAIPALEDRMELFLRDKDIYSLDREIALLRSYLELFDKHILLFKNFTIDELKELGVDFDASELTKSITTLTRNIGKLVEQKHNIEVGRKYVIDVKTVHVIMGIVGEVIDKNVIDPGTREAINHGFNRISLPIAIEH